MSHSTSNYTAANKLMIGVLYVLPYVYNICLPPSSNVSLVLGYDLYSTLRVLNVYCIVHRNLVLQYIVRQFFSVSIAGLGCHSISWNHSTARLFHNKEFSLDKKEYYRINCFQRKKLNREWE